MRIFLSDELQLTKVGKLMDSCAETSITEADTHVRDYIAAIAITFAKAENFLWTYVHF